MKEEKSLPVSGRLSGHKPRQNLLGLHLSREFLFLPFNITKPKQRLKKTCFMKNQFSRGRKLLAALLFLLLSLFSKAQTTLAPGDVYITSFNVDGNNTTTFDGFSFVLLKPVSATTTISFTDVGWNPAGSTWGGATSVSEMYFTWTSSTALPCGSEVVITGGVSGTTASKGTISGITGGPGLNLSPSGDAILAYQGNYASPNFLTGFTNYVSGWTWAGTTTSSGLPATLTNGVNAMAFADIDNWKYGCGTVSGPATTLRNAILSSVNWVSDDFVTLAYTGCIVGCSSPLSAFISSVTNVACNGGSTGVATVTASGGTPPYTYSWSPSGGTAASTTGRSAGSYTVTVTDASGTTKTATASITQPPAIIVSTSQTNVACFGGANGAINVTATGGVGGYTYNWGNGVTTEDRVGLTAGTYSVTITDANGCTSTKNATVTQPGLPVSASTVVTNIACNGGSTGAINVTPLGGTPGYTFNWGGGITTEDRTSLTAGTYTVFITDANGCTSGSLVSVTQPSAIVSSVVSTNASCQGINNGSATVSVSGGTPGYTYNWLPSGGSSAVAKNLGAGAYTLTITDANGCTKTQGATIAAANGSQTGGISGATTGMISQTQLVTDAAGNYLDANCNRITALTPSGANPVTGSVATRIWLEPTLPTHAGSPYVARHYEITPAVNPATSTGTVTLYFLQSDFDDFNGAGSLLKLPTGPSDAAGIANLRVSKYGGTSSDNSGLPGSYNGGVIILDPADNDIVWNSTAGRWEVTFSVTGFSGFFVQTAQSPLPLHLTAFTAAKQDGKVALQWSASFIPSGAMFAVERSSDGKIFSQIGQVAGGAGGGNYRSTDAQPQPLNYYRLKMIDAVGRITYSGVVVVKMNGKDRLELFPNPAGNTLYVQMGTDGVKQLQILDAVGRSVKNMAVNSTGVLSTTVDISRLTPGLYYLKAGSEVISFVKQ